MIRCFLLSIEEMSSLWVHPGAASPVELTLMRLLCSGGSAAKVIVPKPAYTRFRFLCMNHDAIIGFTPGPKPERECGRLRFYSALDLRPFQEDSFGNYLFL